MSESDKFISSLVKIIEENMDNSEFGISVRRAKQEELAGRYLLHDEERKPHEAEPV